MSKKNFSGGLNSLLGNKPQEETEISTTEVATKVWNDNLDETRTTFIINKSILEKIKAIAYWDRLLIKDVMNTALENYIADHEASNGIVKSIPQK